MTEAEWLACTDPTPMLRFLSGKVSPRKIRLIGCACCRRIWHLLGEAARSGLIAQEQYTESKLDEEAFVNARRRVGTELTSLILKRSGGIPICAVTAVVRFFISHDTEPTDLVVRIAADGVSFAAAAAGNGDANHPDAKEQQLQTVLLRDIFGNPFRPVAADARWLTSTVRGLAVAIYADRAFDRLPILADALEDAGCDDADILAHCRGDGPHVRGCWVVDLILGKE